MTQWNDPDRRYAVDQCVRLDELESAVRDAVAKDSPRRAEAVDSLIAGLLAGLLGFASRATDGFVALREELAATSYFGVGKVIFIRDQSVHPVWLDLGFPGEHGVVGTVQVSLHGDEALTPRLEGALFAYPRETVHALEWAHVFERRPEGWALRMVSP
jgi:hypothetical protein